jgi:YfiH family protein
VPLAVLDVDLGPGVRAGFTSRLGGVSTGPWSGLDLALHVGDDPGRVRRNRDLLTGWMGAPVHFVSQVHGSEPECDATVSPVAGTAVGVLVADCVPVLLADPEAGVVAAAHAGRRGLLAGVLQRTVAAMTARGALPARIRAALGPAAGACCYEVPEQLRAEAAGQLPALWSSTRRGTPSLDLAAGCRAVLEAAGVSEVRAVGICTIEDERYYSYRRAAVTGRFAGVVGMIP